MTAMKIKSVLGFVFKLRALGARLSQPQQIENPRTLWNFVRSFGNPGCCGWDTRAPFHLGNTPLGEGGLINRAPKPLPPATRHPPGYDFTISNAATRWLPAATSARVMLRVRVAWAISEPW